MAAASEGEDGDARRGGMETWALEAVTPGADFIVSTADDPG